MRALAYAQSGRPKGRYGVWEFYTRVSLGVAWIRNKIQPAGEAETDEMPSTPVPGEVEAGDTRTALPADEVGTGEMPSTVQAGELATGPPSFTASVYIGLAISAGLALMALAWCYRRRQPSELE